MHPLNVLVWDSLVEDLVGVVVCALKALMARLLVPFAWAPMDSVVRLLAPFAWAPKDSVVRLLAAFAWAPKA